MISRAHIMNAAAAQLRESLWLGIGLNQFRNVYEGLKAGDYAHAHNIFLQTWYELGAVGAVLFSAIGAVAWALLSRRPAALQPYAFASFVSAVLIGAFSWGMWQTWFMAAYAIWVMLLALALEVARRFGQLAQVRGSSPR